MYGDVAEFRSKFFNMDGSRSNLNINPSDYKTLYPLFLFHVSKQSEKLNYSTTDIQIKMHFTANVPANTQAYAITIGDRLINFQSDGNKMSSVLKIIIFYLSFFFFFLVYKKNEHKKIKNVT